MTDIRTSPGVLADSLMRLTEEATAHAVARYPHNREDRLADEAAQYRVLLKVAVTELRAMEEKS